MIVNDVLKGALRKLGALPSGADIPASEGEDALAVLRQMYLEMVGSGMFGRQCEITVPSGTPDFVAPEGARMVTDNLAAINITLPITVQDTWWRYDYGARWLPPAIVTAPTWNNQRPPRDGAVVTAADLARDYNTRTYVYDAALARWTDLAAMDVGDQAPLSTRYGEGIMCELAIRLAPEYGQEPSASIVRGAAQGRSAMVCRWDGPERTVRGNFF